MRTAKRRPRIQPVCSPPGPDEPSPHKPLLGPLSAPLRATKGRFTGCAPAPQPLTTVSPTSAVARTASGFTFFAIDTYTSPVAAVIAERVIASAKPTVSGQGSALDDRGCRLPTKPATRKSGRRSLRETPGDGGWTR